MALPSYQVSSIGTALSQISNPTIIPFLWLPSTPRFYTIRKQAPGRTSLLSFISDVAVFPDPLFLRDCSFDTFCASEGGSPEQWPGAGRTLNVCGIMLLPTSRDCGWVPAHSRKISCDCVAAVFQCSRDYGKLQHTSGARLHLPLTSFFPTPANVAVLWSPLGPLPVGRPHSLYQMSSQ